MNVIKDAYHEATERIKKMNARMDRMEKALKFYADGGHIKKGNEDFGRDGIEVMDEYGVVTSIEDGTKAAMALGVQ